MLIFNDPVSGSLVCSLKLKPQGRTMNILGFFLILLGIIILMGYEDQLIKNKWSSFLFIVAMFAILNGGIMAGYYSGVGAPTEVEATRGFEVETCVGEKNAVGTYSEEESQLFVSLPKGCECKESSKLINYSNKFEKCHWE